MSKITTIFDITSALFNKSRSVESKKKQMKLNIHTIIIAAIAFLE